MRKSLIIVGLCLLVILGIGAVEGLHVNELNALPRDARIVQSKEIHGYGQVVLYEDNHDKSFGIAKLEKKFGFLHRFDGSSYGRTVEEGKPFEATSLGDPNRFIVGVVTTKESNIKYIAVGNHLKGVSSSQSYELSLEEVKANPDDYQLEEIDDQYALFVLDEYTEENWTIRAFDQDGNLVADKIFGDEVRYMNEERAD
ncbi:hypothetical protein [Paenibacillus xylanexedens]|uniref:hypothetical protein n=1 Tax=Paenibacillus xylanexedens TaxID=528191 RepID=UPI00119CC1AD|nr:hypothetical protein [Paenibacillus xylanexedens]